MKTLLLIILVVAPNSYLAVRSPSWKDAKNWKMYNAHGSIIYQCPRDSMQYLPNKPLDADSMAYFLQQVSLLPANKQATWMGAYLVSCEIPQGTTRKILISTYGGFFYDETDKSYYELPQDTRREWLNYLAAFRSGLNH